MFAYRSRVRSQPRPGRLSATAWAMALVLPIAAITGAWTFGTDTRLAIAPDSKLWVEGTSNVRSYSCNGTEIGGGVDVKGQLDTGLEAMGRAVNAVAIDVPVAALDCRNGTMNDHMRKALKASEYPHIRFRMTSHEVVPSAAGGLTVRMAGALTIAGTTKEITMTAHAVEEGDRYRITGSEELNMTEFGVKPPELMLGTLKVHDKVVVRYEIILTVPRPVASR